MNGKSEIFVRNITLIHTYIYIYIYIYILWEGITQIIRIIFAITYIQYNFQFLRIFMNPSYSRSGCIQSITVRYKNINSESITVMIMTIALTGTTTATTKMKGFVVMDPEK